MPLIPIRTINEAVKYLKAGNLVIYPTETAYALGADPANSRAVRAIFSVKNRPAGRPLPLIAASLIMAQQWARFTPAVRSLARRYWPGPFTLVLPSRRRLARGVVAPDGTVALRVSGSRTARSISRALGRPIISTSANQSGHGNSYSPTSIRQQFGNSAATIFFFSSGRLPRRCSSTVVRVQGESVTLLRQGRVRVKLKSKKLKVKSESKNLKVTTRLQGAYRQNFLLLNFGSTLLSVRLRLTRSPIMSLSNDNFCLLHFNF